MINTQRLYGIGLAVELLILVVLLSSCMKQPDYKQDFGPEISWSQISSELNKVELPTADTTEKGEFAYTEVSQKVEDLEKTVVGQRSYTLTKIEEEPKQFLWTIVKEIGELVGGHMKTSTSEEVVTVGKKTDDAALAVTAFENIHAFGSAQTLKPSSERVTYHNLQVTSALVDVPPLVVHRENCGGLSPEQCHKPLSVTKISFDQVVWDGDTGNKVSVYWTFSSAIPFLATVRPYDQGGFTPGLLSECIETVVPYQNQQVNLIQCHDIKDFTFGHN